MSAPWPESEAAARAEVLVRRARRLALAPATGARARVWEAVQKRRGRELERPARRRLGWAMFVAGAACAAAIAVMLVPRGHDTTFTIAASAEAATIDLGGDGRVVAGPGAQATLTRHGDGVELALARGSLLLHVQPRGHKAPFMVRTAAFRARVVGTVLRVVAHGDGTASIAVGHGTVEVTPNGGAPILVHGGERWPATSSDAPSADELVRMGAADLEGAGADAFAPNRPLPAPSQPAATAPRCDALHGEAAVDCWLRVGDDANPVRAEGALYQAGWIRMHEMNDPAFALGIWERERARFPHGVLREEVQTSIIDALVALHRTRAAAAEIADYLRAHPHGLRSAELHFVRGTLLRAADRSCGRARREFAVALEHPAAPWAGRARAAARACR